MAQLACSRPVLLPTAQTARAATGSLYKVTVRVKILTAPFTSRTQPGLCRRCVPAASARAGNHGHRKPLPTRVGCRAARKPPRPPVHQRARDVGPPSPRASRLGRRSSTGSASRTPARAVRGRRAGPAPRFATCRRSSVVGVVPSTDRGKRPPWFAATSILRWIRRAPVVLLPQEVKLGAGQGRSHHQAPWFGRSRQALAGGSPSLFGRRSSRRRGTPSPGRRSTTAAARARAAVVVFPRMRDGSPMRAGTEGGGDGVRSDHEHESMNERR
jgi:hypothetical protein